MAEFSDIVLIKPAGHNWSATEKRSFLIIQAYLTEEEVQAILRRLPLYLSAALRECLAELARQEMDRRQSSDTRHPSGLESGR